MKLVSHQGIDSWNVHYGGYSQWGTWYEYVYEIEICKEAFTMSCITGKPVYDMFYLVLARRYSGYLLTMDNQLKEIAIKHSVRVL